MTRETRLSNLDAYVWKKLDEYLKFCKCSNTPGSEIVRFAVAPTTSEKGQFVTLDNGVTHIHTENIIKLVDKIFVISKGKHDKIIASFIVKIVMLNRAPKTFDDNTIFNYLKVVDTASTRLIKPIMVEEIFKYVNHEMLGLCPGTTQSLVFDIFENYIMLINGLTDDIIKLNPLKQLRLALFK